MNPTKVVILVASFVGVLAVAIMAGSLFETNYAGNFQVKQASFSGDLSVRNNPGVYWQGFGDITTYPVTYTLYFRNESSESNSHSSETGPANVRFTDAGTAKVSGFVQVRLPASEVQRLALHRDYKNFENVANNMIRPLVNGALMTSAALLKAEESYSSRRSEFVSNSEDQVQLGLFQTVTEEHKVEDAEGNDFIERTVKVRFDASGNPVVQKVSPLTVYGMEIVQFTITDIDFDETVDKLITKKKEAEQQKVVARANAELAKQNAITAEEQGKASIATAKAAKEVEKIEAVTTAQKEAEVAKWEKERDSRVAEGALITAKAQAEGNKLKVSAGLTPLERATIQKETAIGVAHELSQITLPQLMVMGGEGKNSPLNPFDAVGLKAFQDIAKEMAADK
jgi:regulator of protease activity HflC (stomatin/prohibitin superfamily)